MDSGRGFMEEIPKDLYEKAEHKYTDSRFPTKPAKSGVFRIGEELEIKGAWFKVKKITLFGIMLKSIKSKPIK